MSKGDPDWDRGKHESESLGGSTQKRRRNKSTNPDRFHELLEESVSVSWWDHDIDSEENKREYESLPRAIISRLINTLVFWPVYILATGMIIIFPLFLGLSSSFTSEYTILVLVSWGLLLSQMQIKGNIINYSREYSKITKATTAIAEVLYYNILSIILILVAAFFGGASGGLIGASIAILGPFVDMKAYNSIRISIAGFFSFYGFWVGKALTESYYLATNENVSKQIAGMIMRVVNSPINILGKTFSRYFTIFPRKLNSEKRSRGLV